MPREIITVQVGQCGNQMGLRWWDVMLQEHLANPHYPEARDALFAETIDSSAEPSNHAHDTNNRNRTSTGVSSSKLRARCVAVDMEEGVLRSMLRGPLRNLFDATFFVSDVSGAGNNWAVGHMEYGDKYIDTISDAVRLQVERCDCVQSFLVMHSLSGGTGSGLGTRILGMLEEEFPHVFRICPVVMPSRVDDVVTAPYNSCFALRELIDHADCVLPMDNDALARMVETAMRRRTTATNNSEGNNTSSTASRGFNAAQPTRTKGLPYDAMNALAAQMLSNLTCAMRFPGPLNMDINEVTTNLVPYPKLHFLATALAPLQVSAHTSVGARTVDAMVSSCLDRDHRLVDLPDSADEGEEEQQAPYTSSPSSHATSRHRSTVLATALIARGPQITVGDLARNVISLRTRLRLPYWNEDGYKTALCGVSPLGHKDSVLMLTNDCAIANKIYGVYRKFMRLYSVRSHVHHYEPYLSFDYFDTTAETLRTVMEDYRYLDTATAPANAPRTMRDLVYF